MSVFWFGLLGGPDVAAPPLAHHLIAARDERIPDEVRGRALLVRRLEMLPVECVARGYLAGSGTADYRRDGAVCGVALPAGLVEASSCRHRSSRRRRRQRGRARRERHLRGRRGDGRCRPGRRAAGPDPRVVLAGSTYAATRGLLLADTKVEFGRLATFVGARGRGAHPGLVPVLAGRGLRAGAAQPSFDKQYVRDWLTSNDSGWDRHRTTPPPPLPDDVVRATRARYIEAYTRLTGGSGPRRCDRRRVISLRRCRRCCRSQPSSTRAAVFTPRTHGRHLRLAPWGAWTPRLIVSVSGLGPGAPLTAAVALADALDARRVPADLAGRPAAPPRGRRVGHSPATGGRRGAAARHADRGRSAGVLPAPARARGRPAPRRRPAQPRRPRPGRRRVRRPGVVDLGRHPERPRRRRRGPGARRRRGGPLAAGGAPYWWRGRSPAWGRAPPRGRPTRRRTEPGLVHLALHAGTPAATAGALVDDALAGARRPWERASSSGAVPRAAPAAGDPEDPGRSRPRRPLKKWGWGRGASRQSSCSEVSTRGCDKRSPRPALMVASAGGVVEPPGG